MVPKDRVEPYVLFAIDNGNSTTISKYFLGSLNPLPITQVIGFYKGFLERGYMCTLSTYKNRVDKSFLKSQECVLIVNSDNSCYFAKTDLSETWGAGRLVETINPFEEEGWTYVEKTSKYFTLE